MDHPLYALVFFDALRVKMRDKGTVRNKAVYLAIEVAPEGREDVLGIWIERTEGAKFWLRVMTEIKSCGDHSNVASPLGTCDSLLAYPPEVRKMVYTTSAIESLNAKLRRSVRIRGHFPNDEAAMKLIWLQLREITKNWKMPPPEWAAAKAQFAVVFGDRFEVNR